jgi:D-glycero-D-manno-heptose 1,7-bisphosphate phosphatase
LPSNLTGCKLGRYIRQPRQNGEKHLPLVVEKEYGIVRCSLRFEEGHLAEFKQELVLPAGIYARFHKEGLHDHQGRPALFIDRDGVLIEEVGYLSRREDVSFIPGAIEAIRTFNYANIPVILATNQAGIGKGYFDWENFEEVQEEITDVLKKGNAFLDAVIACPYHEDGIKEYRFNNHPFRKPNPGMIIFAAEQLGIVLERSWMVGDKLSDIEAAVSAGLYGAVHVETGYGKEQRKNIETLQKNSFRIVFAKNLFEIGSFLISRMAESL